MHCWPCKMDKKPKIFRLAAGYFLKRFPFRYFCLCIFMFFNSLCKLLGRRKIQCENCRFLRLIEGAKFSGLIERGEKKITIERSAVPQKIPKWGPPVWWGGWGGGLDVPVHMVGCLHHMVIRYALWPYPRTEWSKTLEKQGNVCFRASSTPCSQELWLR